MEELEAALLFNSGSGFGIYSVTIESSSGPFVKCNTIRVDRSPAASYLAPEGYVMASSTSSVSMGGAHVVEHYVPSSMLAVNKQILLLANEIDPNENPASGYSPASMTPAERETLYMNLYNPSRVFGMLMGIAGGEGGGGEGGGWTYSGGGVLGILQEVTFGLDVVGMAEIDGLLGKRITPASFMRIVYSGFGLVFVQSGIGGFSLRTLDSIGSEPISVSADEIASISSSYDFLKMAKMSSITMTPDGEIVDGVNNSENVVDIKKSRESNVLNVRAAGAGGVATGEMAEMHAPSIPLLRVARFRGVSVSKGISKMTVGGEEISAPARLIPPRVSGFMGPIIPEEGVEEKWDVSALSIIVKGKLAKKLHSLMAFRNALESTLSSATVEGVALPGFSSFTITGSGSLQKAIINASGVSHETETADPGEGGTIMHSTITSTSGRLVSSISFIDGSFSPTMF